MTSGSTILDVAVEAGYSSHEAFTRAFTRAYGVTPTHLRRQPTWIQIEAPNDVHFHPPGSLRLPAREKASSMDLLLKMVEHHVWLVDQMLTRAATLSDKQLDKGIEISVEGIDDDPTLRSLLSRLVGQIDMWNAAVAGHDYDCAVERGESVRHMRTRLSEVASTFVRLVTDICAQGRLEEAIVCPGEPIEVYTFGGIIAHVLTFAAHRRTLVAGALHDAGFDDLDAGDPIRWVAQPA